jgi:hypothetical protein
MHEEHDANPTDLFADSLCLSTYLLLTRLLDPSSRVNLCPQPAAPSGPRQCHQGQPFIR